MHYGYPDDVDLFAPEFVPRFARFRARRRRGRPRRDGRADLLHAGQRDLVQRLGRRGGRLHGALRERARGRLKRILVRGAIAAAEAIWKVDPAARMLSVDPLVHLHPPAGRPDLRDEAAHFNEHVVTEAFDLLSGRREPELGGSRAHLGILGLNYYSGNQWTIATPEEPQRSLDWEDDDWIPLSELLLGVERRYGGPLVLAETGSAGDSRGPWIEFLAREAARALELGVDLHGICLYPIVTSPDWEDPTAFFDGGLFDLSPQPDGSLRRAIDHASALALRAAQAVLDPENVPRRPLEAPPAASPEPALQLARPLERARLKVDNFAYDTLLAGEHLTVELLCLGPGGDVPGHRHEQSEQLLTVISGRGRFRIGSASVEVGAGESVLAPAGLYHGVKNAADEPLFVQQVSAPKPWDARFAGPHPSSLAPR